MKKLILWMMILLACQFAIAAITDNKNYVQALQHYELGNYSQAKQFLNIIEMQDQNTPEYALLRGKVHLASGEYREAHTWLSKYSLNSLGSETLSNPDLQRKIYEAGLFQDLDPTSISLGVMPGSINSSESEYSPVLSPDGKTLYFSSQRRSLFAKENIFASRLVEERWSEPVEVKELCSDRNEAIGSLSVDGKTAYLFGYYNNADTNGDIYISTQNAGSWSKPTLISTVSSKFYDVQPYVFEDKVMFFTSNRHGIHDNWDIFVSENVNGSWQEPVNIGVAINTGADEQAPFLSNDGRYLYFNSNGHPGYGGTDIFRSERIGNSWTQWTKPDNLGPIINSVKDDRYYFVSHDGKVAYICSNRINGIGLEDIYTIDLSILDSMRQRIANLASKSFNEYNISGNVSDDMGKLIATDIVWNYKLGDRNYMQVVASDEAGNFAFNIPAEATDLTYEVNAPGYRRTNGNVELPKDTPEVVVNIVCSTDQNYQPESSLAFTGNVINEKNEPVKTIVRVSYVFDGEISDIKVETDPMGAFKLYIPQISKLKYNVNEEGYAPREEILTIPADVDTYNTVIRLVSLSNEIRMSGVVTDIADNPLIADIYWSFLQGTETIEYHVVSKSDGTYTVSVPRLPSINYRVAKQNYMEISGSAVIPVDSVNVVKNFKISKLEEAGIFRLDNVNFEFAKSVLTQDSYKILEPVLNTLNNNASLEIELSGHTDSVGSNQYNQKLSEARAQAVADYFIKNKVDAKRIRSVGYGLDKPVATNATPEGRALNRRTELKILGIQYTEDKNDSYNAELDRASQKGKVVKTVSTTSYSSTTAAGAIPASLADQFKAMVSDEIGKRSGNVKVDLFIGDGKIQSAKVFDLGGNLEETLLDKIGDMLIGWKVQSSGRFIYSFTVKK